MEKTVNVLMLAAIILCGAAYLTGVAASINEGNGWMWIIDTSIPPVGMVHGFIVWFHAAAG